MVFDKELDDKLLKVIKFVIENKKITEFHVACEGTFGWKCVDVVNKLKKLYPQIKIYRVLAYIKNGDEREKELNKEFDGTIYPNLETTPKRLAIVKRNNIMIDYADYIIFYCTYIGNISKLIERAKQKHKDYVNLGNFP